MNISISHKVDTVGDDVEPLLSFRITLFWFCAVTSSPNYLSEHKLALLLVWPHLLNPYTDILLKEKSCLFFPKEMLRVPCLDRQHPKLVPVAAAPGRWGGRGRRRLHHMHFNLGRPHHDRKGLERQLFMPGSVASLNCDSVDPAPWGLFFIQHFA